jgi:asparagine synthase (glutamine-hydrolysing)
MCAIVGIVDFAGQFAKRDLEELTRAMRDTMAHRGPDDAGLWTSPDGRVCLGQRRLSIIDLRPEGRQPMLNEDGRVAVTFNGEIYNFKTLRTELEREGHRFFSRTDTEVLCHLFEGEPESAVERLLGMFAFAAWKEETRELVLARDHFGKKPLYYLHHGAFLAFASELRALQLLPQFLGGIDPASVQQYLLLQYVHAPRSIYRHVKKLEPGTCLTVRFGEDGTVHERKHCFFRFEAKEPRRWPFARPRREAELVEELRGLLIEAVGDRMVADVPVGAFLSGGNDSSLVVAMIARELGVRPKTFSIGFTNSPMSEHIPARQIAEHLGADHRELILEPASVDMLPTIVDCLDEPNGDGSCLPVYLLSRFARRDVTVVLTGDGGDEMFGGYGRYTDTIRDSSLRHRLNWRRTQGRRWTASQAYVGCRILTTTENELRTLVAHVEPEAEETLAHMRCVVDSGGPVVHRLRTLDVAMYMPGAVLAKVDRMSMRFALEVRCPLLDARIGKWAGQLPANMCHDGKIAKRILKQLCLRYLPESIVFRPKQGFNSPEPDWAKDRLLKLANELFFDSGSQITAFLDPARLRGHMQRQCDPQFFNYYQTWVMLVLECWLRKSARLTCPVPIAA